MNNQDQSKITKKRIQKHESNNLISVQQSTNDNQQTDQNTNLETNQQNIFKTSKSSEKKFKSIDKKSKSPEIKFKSIENQSKSPKKKFKPKEKISKLIEKKYMKLSSEKVKLANGKKKSKTNQATDPEKTESNPPPYSQPDQNSNQSIYNEFNTDPQVTNVQIFYPTTQPLNFQYSLPQSLSIQSTTNSSSATIPLPSFGTLKNSLSGSPSSNYVIPTTQNQEINYPSYATYYYSSNIIQNIPITNQISNYYCCTFQNSSQCTCSSQVCITNCSCALIGNQIINFSTGLTSEQNNESSNQTYSICSPNDTNNKRQKIYSGIGSVDSQQVDNSNGNTTFTYQNTQLNSNGSYLLPDAYTIPVTQPILNQETANLSNPTSSNNAANKEIQPQSNEEWHSIDAETIEMVEKRIKGLSGKFKLNKRNRLFITDTIGLDLNNLPNYAKIACMFYHLNMKIGSSPISQLFELGVFFGVMIEKHPELMNLEGSGADHLKKAFIDTRKHFIKILKKEGKINGREGAEDGDEDEEEDELTSMISLESSKNDVVSQHDLSSNSTSSLTLNATSLSNQKNCTFVDSK